VAAIVVIALLVALGAARDVGGSPTGPFAAAATVNAQAAGFISPVSQDGTVEQKIGDYIESTTTLPESKNHRFLVAAHIDQVETESGLPLDDARATVTETIDGPYVVHVPFTAGGNRLEISGYTAFLDKDLQVSSTGEVVFTALTEDSGRMQLWQDGTLALDKTATNDAESVNDTDQATIQAAGWSWNTLNKCLLNAGVSQWAITLIGTGCALLCGATLGTGCIVCIVGFAGIAGGTVGTCVGKAMA